MYVPTYYIIVSFVETEKLQHFCDVWSIDLGGRRGVLGHLGTFVKVFSAQINLIKTVDHALQCLKE